MLKHTKMRLENEGF